MTTLALLVEIRSFVHDAGLGEFGHMDPGAAALMKKIDDSVTQRPRIVCLCGSTRFFRRFMEAQYRETMAGHIVLSVGWYPYVSSEAHGEGIGITPEEKERLDQLHMRKIDLADEIFVVNGGGYVGQSTAREILYAMRTSKVVRWLEEDLPKSKDELERIAAGAP